MTPVASGLRSHNNQIAIEQAKSRPGRRDKAHPTGRRPCRRRPLQDTMQSWSSTEPKGLPFGAFLRYRNKNPPFWRSGEPRNTRRLVAVAGRRRASPATSWSAVRNKRAPFWCVPPVLEQKPTILAQHSLRRDLRGGDHDDPDHGERVQDRSAAQPPVRLSSRPVRIPFVFMLLFPFSSRCWKPLQRGPAGSAPAPR
jgi:hypothetical protein